MTTNSTNGRALGKAPWYLRSWFQATSALAPRLAERQAARLFITPRHRTPVAPTDLHEALLPERVAERRQGEALPSFPVLSTGRIAAWSWGHGPTALLTHGWSGSAGDMAPLAAALVRAGFRAVLIDMPGHGSSDPATTNLIVYLQTLAEMSTLVGPLDVAIGHSLGGTATALALGEGLMTARRAVLLAPGRSPWEFSRDFARIIGLPEARVPGMVRRTEEIVGRKADSLDAATAVAGLTLPALIAHDPGDADVPYAHGEAIAAAWRGSTLLPRPGLGHRRILKDPDTIAAATAFVGRTS